MKKITINSYYKTLKLIDKNGDIYDHKIFDYEKIWESEIPVYLIISERGAKAKSTQAKRQARIIFENEKLRTLWVMNSKTLIDKEKKSHLTKPFTYLADIFSGEEKQIGEYIYINKDKNSWYTKFVNLGVAENEKGSRDDYGMMIYDEFNVLPAQLKNKQVDSLSSIIGTLEDPINKVDDKFRKLILHGNNKSLSNMLLISLGVSIIKDEITDIYIGDFLLLRILCPLTDETEKKRITEANKDNWKFLLQKKLGKLDHTYFNKSLHDEINNVNTYMLALPDIEKHYIKIKDMYFIISIKSGDTVGNCLYFYDVDKKHTKGKQVYCISKSDLAEGIIYNPNLKKSLLDNLYLNNIYFKEVYIRDFVIMSLNK